MAQLPVEQISPSVVLHNPNFFLAPRKYSPSDMSDELLGVQTHCWSDEKILVSPLDPSPTHDADEFPPPRDSMRKSSMSFIDTVLRRRKTGSSDYSQHLRPLPDHELNQRKTPSRQSSMQFIPQIVPDFELNREDPRYLRSTTVSVALRPSNEAVEYYTPTSPVAPDRKPYASGQEYALENMRATYIQEIQDRDARIAHLENQLADMVAQITEISQDRKRLQSQLRNTQNTQNGPRRSVKTVPWASKSTARVREELSILEKRMRSWAVKYTVSDPRDLEQVTAEEKNSVLKELDGFCIERDWDRLMRTMPIVLHRIPALLTQAMLSRAIFTGVFVRPFFAFTESEEETTDDWASSRMLTSIYTAMMDVNESEAHTWRSQMLRILSTPPPDSTESVLHQRMREVINELAVDFLNGPIQALFRPPKENLEIVRRNQELYNLYHDAGELALSLWRQRAFMKFHNLHGLQIFRTGNPAMAAHPLQQLDMDDERLDGKRVLLVVQPAIVAYGDEDAQNYDMCKVWAEGVVLVDEHEGEDFQSMAVHMPSTDRMGWD
ncbi:hypothetical protein EYZ11_010429 [Aspergillus tanneri]|uniref:Uncharacterized protein n=1 Tax=Aspergillus tanneri TaxID=1220188 RepID=A0A4V3UN77_9EURO|nr:uncharacterized protein ATNIH1004_006513 [Aspergillus tanneri]KAA8647811.1 hypothetical protein ATNIH1004_006513 [Aspergillus tanneri]THC90114.1 hypothetical protein EYZ11_010429 [Aspergillus tanneri]